jgi:tetratricopeptide (TPR) repeat protein
LGFNGLRFRFRHDNWARLAAGAAAAAADYCCELDKDGIASRGRWYSIGDGRGCAGRLRRPRSSFGVRWITTRTRREPNQPGILRGLAGDFTDAEAQFRRLLAVQTNRKCRITGLALYRQGRAMEALPYFDRALELDPEFIQARNNRAAAAAASRADNGIALP